MKRFFIATAHDADLPSPHLWYLVLERWSNKWRDAVVVYGTVDPHEAESERTRRNEEEAR